MSWSESFRDLDLDGLKALEPTNDITKQHPEQFEAAKVALVGLVESGCMGTDVRFSGALNGHENEGHKPMPGWSNDCVYLSVAQVREESTLDKAANKEGGLYI